MVMNTSPVISTILVDTLCITFEKIEVTDDPEQ